MGSEQPPGGEERQVPPELSTEAIFRQMIENEVRNGRLSKSRRKRIVQYAAQLRLSAVDAGKLVEEIRQRVESPRKPSRVTFTYHPVDEGPAGPSTVWLMWLIVVAAVIFDLIMIKWLSF